MPKANEPNNLKQIDKNFDVTRSFTCDQTRLTPTNCSSNHSDGSWTMVFMENLVNSFKGMERRESFFFLGINLPSLDRLLLQGFHKND